MRGFRTTYGRVPGPTAAVAWDAIHLITDAIERSSLDRPSLRAAIDATSDFPGAAGRITFAGGKRVGLDHGAFVVARASAGGWRLPG